MSSPSSCSIRLQWVPRHSFLPGSDAADELARLGALLVLSAIPCSLFVFSRTGGVVSHLNSFNTQVSSISIEKLVLSHLRHNGHSLLLSSYLSAIGRIKNPCSAPGHLSSHSALSSDGLCAARSLTTLCLHDLWSRPWRVARLFGLHGRPSCSYPSEGAEWQQQNLCLIGFVKTSRLRSVFSK